MFITLHTTKHISSKKVGFILQIIHVFQKKLPIMDISLTVYAEIGL